MTESPTEMARGECPEYRKNNPGQAYYWDRLAFRNRLEAEIAYCSQIDTGPLANWVVEERSDEDGSYSVSAYVYASDHAVTHNWGSFEPTLWVSCWLAGADAEVELTSDGSTDGTTQGKSLDVSLWYFGPPQAEYGEPTPVRYRFEEGSGDRTLIWYGHPGQAELALLRPPDSHRFAREMRRAARAHDDEDLGPMLTVETWEGGSLTARGPSQGLIEFDLIGLERAAFPVFDACRITG